MSSNKSVAQLEAEITAARDRLAVTVDELAQRSRPQAIARRQVESARAAFAHMTQTPDGSLRRERIAAMVAVGVLLIAAGLRARRKR